MTEPPDADHETFEQAFERWSGFRDGEYFEELDAIGLWKRHDKLHSAKHPEVRTLDAIADMVAGEMPKDADLRRRQLRLERHSLNLINLSQKGKLPECQEIMQLDEAQREWGKTCLEAFYRGDTEFFLDLLNTAKAYDRKEDRLLYAQVIEIAWDLRCSLNRDPTKEELIRRAESLKLRVGDWRGVWRNARLGFLPE